MEADAHTLFEYPLGSLSKLSFKINFLNIYLVPGTRCLIEYSIPTYNRYITPGELNFTYYKYLGGFGTQNVWTLTGPAAEESAKPGETQP